MLVTGDAYLHKEVAKARMTHFYNRKVKEWPFATRDLVLRKIEARGNGAIQRKLAPNWEGPYLISEEVRLKTFRL